MACTSAWINRFPLVVMPYITLQLLEDSIIQEVDNIWYWSKIGSGMWTASVLRVIPE